MTVKSLFGAPEHHSSMLCLPLPLSNFPEMSPSVRYQTKARKQGGEIIFSGLEAKKKAIHLFKTSKLSPRKITESTRLSKTLVGNLKKLLPNDELDERQCREFEETKKGAKMYFPKMRKNDCSTPHICS